MRPLLRTLRPIALILLVAAALAWPPLADAQRDSRPSVRRLRDMRSLRSAAKRHPYTRKVVSRVVQARGRTIDSVGDVEAERIAERLGWVPLGADPELRRVTVATVLRKVRQRSKGLRRLIKEKPNDAAWDIIFVGAGVHTAIAANTLANLDTDDPVRMLTIEAADDIGGTFRDVGSTVARNSANRAGTRGGSVRRGFGDKNPSEGPWGDPDLDGQEWPELDIMADTATVNLFASGSDFLLGSRVDKIEFRDDVAGSDGWPARHRVSLADGTVVYANAIARATGSGQPTIGASVDQNTRNLWQAERAKIDFKDPDKVPDLLHYADAMKLANLSRRGRDPYRAKPGPVRELVELRGLKVKTSPATVLRLNAPGRSEVPLEEAIDFAFDSAAGGWNLKLTDGSSLVVRRLVAEVANREIVLQQGETLADLARKLETFALPEPPRVRIQPVRKRVRPPRFSAEQRISQLQARLGGLALDQFQLRNELNALESAGLIADVFNEEGNTLTVVRKDGTRFRVTQLQLFRGNRNTNNFTFNDTLFAEPGELSRPVIAVVGGRDSGRTFLEYLYGQAPASAYTGRGKVDTAQRGEIGDVEWFVGQNGPADCDTFLKTTRSRYLRLAGKIRDAGDGSTPRARINKVRVVRVLRLPTGRYQIVDSAGGMKVVDKVIFATGFESFPNEDGQVETLTGAVPGLTGERVLAKRVRGRDIFRFGPASGDDVVAADERYATDENGGSVYAFAPRDRQFARTVLARTVRAVAALDTPSLEKRPRLTLAEGQSSAPLERAEPAGRPFETPLSDLVLRAEMMDALYQVRGARTRDRLSFRIARAADTGALRIEDCNHDQADKLAGLINDSPLLMDQLEAATEEGGSVEFSVPLVAGVPSRARLKVSM